jgi:hypothetical protein
MPRDMMNVSMRVIEILHECLFILDSENPSWKTAKTLMKNGIQGELWEFRALRIHGLGAACAHQSRVMMMIPIIVDL